MEKQKHPPDKAAVNLQGKNSTPQWTWLQK